MIMKNDEQMFQSVLLRRDEYRARKSRRIRTVRRTAPVFAGFCLTIALGAGYRTYSRNRPQIPAEPDRTEESAAELPSAAVSAEASASVATEMPSESATAAAPVQSTEAEHTASVMPKQTETVTAAVTDAGTNKKTEPTTNQPDKTQASSTTPPDPVTQPGTEPIRPVMPPVQPVLFADIHAAADAVRTGDVSAYPEQEEQQAYLYLYDRINSDGFLYQVKQTDTVSLMDDRGIYLLPYAVYEDVGIGCYVTFREKNYHITFYYADRSLIARTNRIAEYLQSRTGCRSDKEIRVSDTDVSLFFADNGQTYAGAMIDETHYFAVNAAVSEEEMTDFLKALCFEALPLS